MHSRFFLPATVALLAILALAAYWPALGGPFAYDSIPAIKLNPDLRLDDQAFDEWYAAALSGAAGPSLRPVAMLSFALNVAVWGVDAPLAFRLSNLALHGFNALLVLWAVNILCSVVADSRAGVVSPRARPMAISVLAAGIFLLHPLQLTAVVHDVQRMVLLATTFQLLALMVFLQGRAHWSLQGAGRVRACNDLTWIALLTTLGFLSKENALLTPLLLLVVEAFWFSRTPRRMLLAAFGIPVVAVAAWMLLGGAAVLESMYATRNFDLGDRLLTQAKVLWIYLYWFFQPTALTAGMHHDDIAISTTMAAPWVVAAVLGWLLVGALMMLGTGRHRGLRLTAFAFAWFLVSHLMESTVVPLEMVFEHRNYGALLGFVLVAAVLVHRMADALPRSVTPVLPILVLASLCGLLTLRALAWTSPMTLAVHSVAERPDSLRSRADLAEARFNLALQRNDRELAIAAREDFDRLSTRMPDALLPLARLIEIDGILGEPERLAGHTERFLAGLRKPSLTIQDRIALDLMGGCAERRGCVGSEAAARILDALAARPDIRPGELTLRRARLALARSADPLPALAIIEAGPPLEAYTPRELVEIAVWRGRARQPALALELIRTAMHEDRLGRLTALFRGLYSQSKPH